MALQKEAVIMLDNVDPPIENHSAEFYTFVLKASKEQIVEDPTYGLAETTTTLGTKQWVVDVRFKSAQSATTVFGLMAAAMNTDDGILYFSVKYDAVAAVGVNNPEYKGQLVIANLDYGAIAGARWEQTFTFPAQAVVIDVTP